MRSRTRRRYAARVVSYSQCQTAQSSSFPPALLRPGSFSSLSLLSVGWVERQRHPSPVLADRVRWVSRTALNPSYEIRVFRFFVPGTFVPGFFFLLSFRSPDRGDGGAPGGGILYSVARVIGRRH